MKKIIMPNDTFCIPDTANLLNDDPLKQQKDLDAIVKVLEYSDIVWTRYGTETIQDLALKILKVIKE